MSVDERRRLELADAAKRTFGDDAGITLMELLPPVGWADVATKQDVAVVRADVDLLRDDIGRLCAEFDGMRGEFADLRGEFGELRGEFAELRGEFRFFTKDVEARIERQFREMLVTMTSLTIGGFLVAIVAIVASALIS